jgi:hypothetical protein
MKRQPKTERIGLALEPELRQRVEEYAAQHAVSMSTVMRWALIRWLAEQRPRAAE